MDERHTYRWVADRSSAADAARSFGRGARRRRGLWAWLAVVTLLVGVYVSTGIDARLSPAARLAWGVAWAAAFGALATAVVWAVVGRLNRRWFRQRLRPGDELTSSFGPTALELGSPLSRHELRYEGLDSVQRVGDWVHLRQVGSRVTMLWPAALFPDEELDRLRQVVARRKGRCDT